MAPTQPPESRARDKSAGRARTAGLCLLAAGLAFYYASVLSVPIAGTWRMDLDPNPDGEEYVAGAVSMVRDGDYTLTVAGRALPPRFPFGYSLLLAPAIALGAPPEYVPYDVNGALGLAILLGVFAVLWKDGHEPAAGLAVLLLATWPGFVILCRSPMSDVMSAAIVLFACWGFVAFGERHPGTTGTTGTPGPRNRLSLASFRILESGGRVGLAAAFALGVSIWVRTANVFLVPLLLVVPLARRVSWRERLEAILWFGAAFAVGVLPYAWYNFRHFGSPLRTAYEVWMPSWMPVDEAFKVPFLASNAGYWWRDLLGIGPAYTLAIVYGLGSYLSIGLVGLVLVTVVVRLRRRSEIAVAIALALNVALLAFCEFKDARLLFATVLVAAVFAARETGALLRSAYYSRQVVLTTVVTALVALSIVGYCDRAPGLEILGLLDLTRFGRVSEHNSLVRALDRRADAGAALVVTDFNPAYVSALLSSRPLVIPTDAQFVPESEHDAWDFAGPAKSILQAVHDGRPVYLLAAHHTPEAANLLAPAPEGYEWHTVYAENAHAALSVLLAK